MSSVEDVEELSATFSIIIQLPPTVIGFPYTKVDIYPPHLQHFTEKTAKSLRLSHCKP